MTCSRSFTATESPSSSPPITEVGGVQAMSAHDSGIVTLIFDFDAGNYVAICFLLDSEIGRPRFALGMIEESANQYAIQTASSGKRRRVRGGFAPLRRFQ